MRRVLIVEDSATNMLLAVTILERAGYDTLQAENAANGLDLARGERPDIVLMDMQLPDMDGIEATRILKADPSTCDIPVIALTAFAMKGDRERFLDAGCDGYIEKPIRYQVFLAELNRILPPSPEGESAAETNSPAR